MYAHQFLHRCALVMMNLPTRPSRTSAAVWAASTASGERLIRVSDRRPPGQDVLLSMRPWLVGPAQSFKQGVRGGRACNSGKARGDLLNPELSRGLGIFGQVFPVQAGSLSPQKLRRLRPRLDSRPPPFASRAPFSPDRLHASPPAPPPESLQSELVRASDSLAPEARALRGFGETSEDAGELEKPVASVVQEDGGGLMENLFDRGRRRDSGDRR